MKAVRLGDRDYVVPDYATGRFVGFSLRHHWDVEREGIFVVERWGWRARWAHRIRRLWGRSVGDKSMVSLEQTMVSGPDSAIHVGDTVGVRIDGQS